MRRKYPSIFPTCRKSNETDTKLDFEYWNKNNESNKIEWNRYKTSNIIVLHFFYY